MALIWKLLETTGENTAKDGPDNKLTFQKSNDIVNKPAPICDMATSQACDWLAINNTTDRQANKKTDMEGG